jgi:hypothetical protein
MLYGMKDDADHIVDGHPRHPMLPLPDRSPEAHLERDQHRLECPASKAQDHPDPQHHDSHVKFLGPPGLGFHRLTDLCEKVTSRCGVFVQLFLPPTAVVADG